ncbi:carbamoyl phosphate synthase small subunit [Halobacillus sp. BBL2006]|uniref:carbamoyl phosphate synthase small subunit n=1 Tax=Halobacillus sp. BBL2006 TaxID=1543706 RepID=UPI0005420424|nr:carbamoyl phosphate synthase small subunit [Halobacillus sp. BBL2006]KHE72671.1 carbamoyl phosphate synthase small subunit [Halobacillus sp. BBL2006]
MQGYLCLQDGNSFQGQASQQWDAATQGEIVFFTGMTGYQEVLTDPSYKGQIVVFTYPLIGNYGINENDSESSQIQVSGVVMARCAERATHYLATTTLKAYLNKHNVPYLTEVDTRAVTKMIREGGTRQASLSNTTTTKFGVPMNNHVYKSKGAGVQTYGKGSMHIVLIDFGWKKSILTSLVNKGIQVSVVPFTQIDHLDDLKPDGVVLSNGPGNPKDVQNELPKIKKVLDHYPSFGICMGHQVIALAYGANTKKLTFGHRGANHPVKDVVTGKVFLSSQNHNYVVDEESLKDTSLVTRFFNVNDGSVEGVSHKEKPILSAQFHPEANPGPEDAEWLFDDFLKMIKLKKEEKAYV